MARIVFASYLIRYPVGGYQSWILQWLVGFQRLGHEVFFVEKSGWADSCFDIQAQHSGNDPTTGIQVISTLFARYGLADRWCFVAHDGTYLGMTKSQVGEVFRTADLFVDTMQVCEWQEEARDAATTVCVDGEPGYRQMRMARLEAGGTKYFPFDHYFTVGRNLGTSRSSIPTVNRLWRPTFDPVVLDLFSPGTPTPHGPWTTVTSWQVHQPFEYDGVTYGQKDLEFDRFMTLPSQVDVDVELAIAAKSAPRQKLLSAGWRVRDSHQVTLTFDGWRDYIASSRGEFSVAKNVFVQTNSGFFSDRSAAYLASGRPVVLQETGFSAHLPCGQGLFAVRDVSEAAAAIREVEGNYERHSRAALEIACAYLDARKVLAGFLNDIGM